MSPLAPLGRGVTPNYRFPLQSEHWAVSDGTVESVEYMYPAGCVGLIFVPSYFAQIFDRDCDQDGALILTLHPRSYRGREL